MHLHYVQPDDLEERFVIYGPADTWLGADDAVDLRYWFAEDADSADVTLRILEEDGDIIRSFDGDDVRREKGVNTFSWNMRYPDAEDFEGLIMWAGSVRGPRAVPGDYMARLIVDDDSTDVTFTIRADPRSETTQAELQEQFDFLVDVRDKLTETHEAIKQIRSVRTQVDDILGRVPDDHTDADTLASYAEAMLDDMRVIEEALYQTKNESGQDPLNFPIRLNNKLAAVGGVVASGSYPPTDQAYAVYDEIVRQIDDELARLTQIMDYRIPEFEAMVDAADLPVLDRE